MGAILLDRDAVSGQQRTDEEHGELRKIEEKASRFGAGMNPTTETLNTSFITLDSIS